MDEISGKMQTLKITKEEKKLKKESMVKVKEVDPNKANQDTHAYMVMDTRFEVDKKYEIIDMIGYGAYGVVVCAKDTSLPELKQEGESNLVAIKKMVKALDHKVFSLRTYRELKI